VGGDGGPVGAAARAPGAPQAMQALAGWQEQRPQLGHDVFARGRPELFGVSAEAGPAIDMIEFLWASLALFDDEEPPDTAMVHRPAPLRLHIVAQARDRILQRLKDAPGGTALPQLLPDEALDDGMAPDRALQRRSGWLATFVAGLELAKQGDVVMAQEGELRPSTSPRPDGLPTRFTHRIRRRGTSSRTLELRLAGQMVLQRYGGSRAFTD
jgi:hypothetical protein